MEENQVQRKFFKNFLYFKRKKKDRLNQEEILLILEEMDNQGRISWKNSEIKGDFFVNKYSCYELADAIYKWVSFFAKKF